MEEQMDLMSAAPFQNAFPKPYVKKNAEGSAKNKSELPLTFSARHEFISHSIFNTQTTAMANICVCDTYVLWHGV